MKKSLLSTLLIAIIISGLILVVTVHFGTAQSGTPTSTPAATFQGWQVENGGGQISQNNGIMSLSGNNGTYVILYEQIAPTGDFNFSLQVNAATLEGFAIMLRSSLPFAGSTQGVNFEFGARDGGTFLLARYSNGWTWNGFASNITQNVNYTMILSVYQNPFRITATALDQNGNSLGSYSASDMTNLAFNNINYIGFGVLESGGNYTVGNISGTNIPIPSTPTPTPTPAPTPTQSLLPTPTIAISCQSSTSYSNFNVEINGNITSDGVSLSGVSILLSYSVNEGNSWNDLTTVSADSSGSFSAVWLPSVTGNYLLRATYIGNSNYSETSTTVNFAVLPFEDQSVFSVTSNSTLSGFAFNSTSNQISFTVSGPSGTTGYVNVCISKTLIADISNVQVFLDGTQISYSVQQQTDSWIISFQYHHSTHQININLNSALSTSTSSPNEKLPEQSFIYVIIAVAIVFVIAVSLIVRRKRNKNLSPKI